MVLLSPEGTNGPIKTQLQNSESCHLPWPKALSLVSLNLRSTPFPKHRPPPLGITTGRRMELDGGMYEPALLKGGLPINCTELTRAPKTNSVHRASTARRAPREKPSTTLSIRIPSPGNASSMKMPFCLLERATSGMIY